MDPLHLPVIGMILSTVTVPMLLKHLNICVNDVQPTLYIINCFLHCVVGKATSQNPHYQ